VEAESSAFEFVVVNDTHYVDEKCKPWQSAVATAMHASSPEAVFCALVGDIADGGDLEACKAIKELYGAAMGRLYTVPGNHDYLADDDRSGYDAVFPDRLNYVFRHMGWQFVGLDTTQGTKFDGTDISPATFAWLDENLPKLDQKLPSFVFTPLSSRRRRSVPPTECRRLDRAAFPPECELGSTVAIGMARAIARQDD
jgi:3',5'-cyclic AMP phosphodiesterase CpdA